MHNPPHPGEVLFDLYIEPSDKNMTETAQALNITRSALSEICHGKRAVTPKVAIKLSKAFGGSAERWVSMQAKYDLWQTQQVYTADDVEQLATA